MKILIVAPAWIGDAVLASPLIQRLIERYPEAQIDALAPGWVASVLTRMPQIRQVIPSSFEHGELALLGRYSLARKLAHERYDMAFILPNSYKSALIPFFARIPIRVGFVGESRYGLVNRCHRLDPERLPQMAERFAQLAEMPGEPLRQPLAMPQLISTVTTRQATLASLALVRPHKLAIFCPGAEYGPAKRWPPVHFAALANLCRERDVTVWLLGSAHEQAIGDEITRLAPHVCHNLCGKTTLEQAIDLIALADFVVCNDSGLMHIAAALNVPLIALYGSSSPAFTPPLSERAHVLSLQLECSPCFKRHCPLGHLDCLQQLVPEQVFQACLSHL